MTPRVLILQHTDYCPPGPLADFLAADGVPTSTVRFDHGDTVPDLADFDVMMVMGGGMDVWEETDNPWLIPEKQAIQRWVSELGKPYLGICLGHQLLAEALGGTVGPAKTPEVALLDIEMTDAGHVHPLFAGFGGHKRVVQWHGAEVTKLPAQAKVLARSADCAVSAFEVASTAYGIQYHVEATEQSIAAWSASPRSAAWLKQLHGPKAGERLYAEVAAARPALLANAKRLYDNFMGIARTRLGDRSPTAPGNPDYVTEAR